MKTFFSLSIAALSLAAGSLASLAPVAAQDLELRIGPDGVRPIVRDRDRPIERERPRDRGCSERAARAAARDAGLRNPQVVRVTPRRIIVEGMTRRGPDEIVFANVRGCPEL